MKFLVDSSVWIDYWRSGLSSVGLDQLIDENMVVTNDIILAELIPALKLRAHHKVVRILQSFEKISLTIDWDKVIELQTKCLHNGLNGIGIPDLLIAQNCVQNSLTLWSLDKHFAHLTPMAGLKLKTV